jgi:predicted outer membrane repeat protein
MRCLGILIVLTFACGEVPVRGDGGGENHAPTSISLSAASVEEQALAGTVVGNLTVDDPDAGDMHTFELTDNGGGLFAVDGAELRVAMDAVINYEAGAKRTVTVRATDKAGASVDKTLEIEIKDLREVVNLTNMGAGSLRQTIADAAPGETVLFESGLTGRISVLTPILLNKAVTLRGPADRSITLDALDMGNIFQVPVGSTVSLVDLRLIQGAGSAVTNAGTLTVLRSTIEDSNAANTGRGGAIFSNGTLTVVDSVFRNNTAFNGGAIAADGTATTVVGSTFETNATSGNSGGAIIGGALRVINCTFTGNAATGTDRVGGAIGVFRDTNVIAFSTFVANTATGAGGGVFASNATLTIRASIFSGNTGVATAPEISASTATGGGNVVSNAAGSSFQNGVNGNLVGVTTTLAALANNGGPTPTRLPAAGSAAIDHVPVASCTDLMDQPLAVDQRRSNRPKGAACDAGAVESP